MDTLHNFHRRVCHTLPHHRHCTHQPWNHTNPRTAGHHSRHWSNNQRTYRRASSMERIQQWECCLRATTYQCRRQHLHSHLTTLTHQICNHLYTTINWAPPSHVWQYHSYWPSWKWNPVQNCLQSIWTHWSIIFPNWRRHGLHRGRKQCLHHQWSCNKQCTIQAYIQHWNVPQSK